MVSHEIEKLINASLQKVLYYERYEKVAPYGRHERHSELLCPVLHSVYGEALGTHGFFLHNFQGHTILTLTPKDPGKLKAVSSIAPASL